MTVNDEIEVNTSDESSMCEAEKKPLWKRIQIVEKKLNNHNEMLQRPRVQANPKRKELLETRRDALEERLTKLQAAKARKMEQKAATVDSTMTVNDEVEIKSSDERSNCDEAKKPLWKRIKMVETKLNRHKEMLERPAVKANPKRKELLETRRNALEEQLTKLQTAKARKMERKQAKQQQMNKKGGAKENKNGQNNQTSEQRMEMVQKRLKNHEAMLQRKQVQNNTARYAAIQERCEKMKVRLEALQNKCDGKLVETVSDDEMMEQEPKKPKNLQERITMLEEKLKHQEYLLAQKTLEDKKVEIITKRRDNIQARLTKIREVQQKRQQHRREMKKQDMPERRQAMEQKRVKQMEQRIRKQAEDSLFKIALDQIYVAHYPKDMANVDDAVGMGSPLGNGGKAYIPLFGKQHNPQVIALRAKIRNEAIQIARSEGQSSWITPEMYTRLPQVWTLEDEMAYFGNRYGKKEKNRALKLAMREHAAKKDIPNKNNADVGVEEKMIFSDFSCLDLNENKAAEESDEKSAENEDVVFVDHEDDDSCAFAHSEDEVDTNDLKVRGNGKEKATTERRAQKQKAQLESKAKREEIKMERFAQRQAKKEAKMERVAERQAVKMEGVAEL